MNKDELLPLIRVRPRDLAPRALVVGDPARAADAAQMLDHAQELGYWREYRTFAGDYKGQRIVICSHGIGSAGAAVCFEELIHGGVRILIRAGTCGAMAKEIEDGEFIIATASVRDDGTTPQLVPLSYPAVADYRVVAALQAAAVAEGFSKPNIGIARTTAAFYPGVLSSDVQTWLDARVIAVEMELATLLVIASLRGARAGGLFVSDGNVARGLEAARGGQTLDPFAYNPHREVVHQGVQVMLKVALEALVRLD